MKTLLIKNVVLNGKTTDILVHDNIIHKIAPSIEEPADRVLEGKGKYVLPPFVNMHTHAGMAPLRGFSEDKSLLEWLSEIWGVESRMDAELLYWSNRLAALEMIKTGTCTFNDMYWQPEVIARAVRESGLRAVISYVFLDGGNAQKQNRQREEFLEAYERSKDWCDRTRFAVSCHAHYTVCDENLRYAAEFSREHDLLLHTHISETEDENVDFFEKYRVTPTRRLYNLGVLGRNVIAAHGLWMEDEDIDIFAREGVTVVHNINSNLKLASGHRFRYREMKDAGINITLGTDGVASSNNLDMLEAMKNAGLSQKGWRGDATVMKLNELLDMATINGAKALHINNGKIEEGKLADMLLVDVGSVFFIPNTNFLANLVYAANSSCIDTLICDGEVLMEGHKVKDEEEILSACRDIFSSFLKKITK